jgi:hypothetical protein
MTKKQSWHWWDSSGKEANTWGPHVTLSATNEEQFKYSSNKNNC